MTAHPLHEGARSPPSAREGIAARLVRSGREGGARWGPIALAVAFLAERAIAAVLGKVGHAAAPLDDAYIHFQYARALAEGHPLRFQAGEPTTSGATSLLWSLALAPFWLLGARGEGIVWAAWVLSFVALGGLAWEATRWTDRLAGRVASVGAGAMTLAFGGFLWCAASGMEVVPFAWLVARAARRASEWVEAPKDERSPGRAAELVALAWAASWMRPEGAVTALLVTAALAGCRRRAGIRGWASSLGAVAGLVAPPLFLLAVTGSARSSTAVAKLLPGNPYYVGPALTAAVRANVRIFVETILNGEVWSAEFLPAGGAPLAVAGLAAVAWLGARTRSRFRAFTVLVVAITMLAPCFYVTFLWNRLRYLWPFATGWLVGLACLARLAGDVAALARPRWRAATLLLCGVFTGLLASKLPWVIEDVAQSASGIDRQQVALGRWAKDALPAEARIGVNDTGAIAYFGERKTFDVVGLTTRNEARYWVAGAGSRLEHYERLRRSAPERLPTHFIVYPEWLAIDAVLGKTLHEATVTDATILGGRTMRAYAADWSTLGSGESPWTALTQPIVDAIDVADLESEAEHAYDLLGARDGEAVAAKGTAPTGEAVIDGGRTQRRADRFLAHLRRGLPATGILRFEAADGGRIEVFVQGRLTAGFDAEETDTWRERTFDVPADLATPETPIEVRIDGGVMTTFHYWFAQ